MPHPELILFFLAIAFIYASVGFGGGSSYLAILALYSIPFQEMKLTALVCNIIVVTGGTLIYLRRRELPIRKTLPLALASVPLAFAGASMRISQATFFLVLGCCLISAGILLWIKPLQATEMSATNQKSNIIREVLLGASIGFLSGMVGIGGGIFLAPVLNLMKWDTPKKIAATASFFILVNSISGIAGQLSSLTTEINFFNIAILAAAVFIGGQLGSRMGANKFSQLIVRRMTATLVFVAGVEVLIKHLH
jgi:uncharacterized protein